MEHHDLAGLVCARICHDLGSPVGAVINAADLIRELGAKDAAEEAAMLERSARRAAAILRFHRLAFGAVNDRQATLARRELCARAEEVLGGPRVEIACSASAGPPIRAPVAQLAALMLLAGRAMLGIGGTLRIVLPEDDDLPLAVTAEGARAAVGPDQRRWLEGGPGPGPDAPEVEFALIPVAAAAAGARVELSESAGRLALRTLPA